MYPVTDQPQALMAHSFAAQCRGLLLKFIVFLFYRSMRYLHLPHNIDFPEDPSLCNSAGHNGRLHSLGDLDSGVSAAAVTWG